MGNQQANRAQGETMGPEQEPTKAGDQDPARRDPRPEGPMEEDADGASDRFGESPDAAYGQREDQADAGTPPSEPHDPVPIDPEWAFALLDPRSEHALARVAPFWREVWADGAPTAHWFLQAGQYEMTPDRRPYLGPAGPDGLFVNAGYSGHGIMAGPAASRLVIDAIIGRADPALEPFRADRTPVPRAHDIL